MTMELNRYQFENAARLAAFVIVDPCTNMLHTGLGPRNAFFAGIVQNLRRALAQARDLGLPVVFVRSESNRSPWIKGFEPKREDVLLTRPMLSCYSNGYFDELVQASGRHIVLCGFPGRGGCIATAASAIHAGHALTVLRDATIDDFADMVSDSLLRHLTAFAEFEISALSTRGWISSAQQGGF